MESTTFYNLTITYLEPHENIYVDLEFKKMTKKEMIKQTKLMMKSYYVIKVKWEREE